MVDCIRGFNSLSLLASVPWPWPHYKGRIHLCLGLRHVTYYVPVSSQVRSSETSHILSCCPVPLLSTWEEQTPASSRVPGGGRDNRAQLLQLLQLPPNLFCIEEQSQPAKPSWGELTSHQPWPRGPAQCRWVSCLVSPGQIHWPQLTPSYKSDNKRSLSCVTESVMQQ